MFLILVMTMTYSDAVFCKPYAKVIASYEKLICPCAPPTVVYLSECSAYGGVLKYPDQWYIPNYKPLHTHIIWTHHDSRTAGYPGCAITFKLVFREYHRPGLRKDNDCYFRNCQTCSRAKSRRHAPYGELK